MVSLAGPLAMISCEPRQARKGATVTADSCAVVRLAGDTSNYRHLACPRLLLLAVARR